MDISAQASDGTVIFNVNEHQAEQHSQHRTTAAPMAWLAMVQGAEEGSRNAGQSRAPAVERRKIAASLLDTHNIAMHIPKH